MAKKKTSNIEEMKRSTVSTKEKASQILTSNSRVDVVYGPSQDGPDLGSHLQIAHPFAEAVEAEAAQLVTQYSMVVKFDADVEAFVAHPLEYPEAIGSGDSEQEAINEARESAMAGVCTMLEAGDPVPTPVVSQGRTEQVNIRLTSEEKMVLESRARVKGFRGISDFIRTAALGG